MVIISIIHPMHTSTNLALINLMYLLIIKSFVKKCISEKKKEKEKGNCLAKLKKGN